MPLYGYTCASCGPFSALRPLTAFKDPGICPRCRSASPKALSSPAYLGASKRQSVYDAIASHPSRNAFQKTSLQTTGHGMNCSCCKPLIAPPREV